MSVRKRAWKTTKGEQKEAWLADYVDQAGRRHVKTFKRKKDADSFLTTARFEVREGTHTVDSQSVTISEAGELWITSCEANNLERTTVEAYRQHLHLHINPFLGRTKLSQLTVPMAREFEDKLRRGDPAPGEELGKARSPAMVRKILTTLGTLMADAQERGLCSRNVVRDLRSRRNKGKERRAERRQKRKLEVGVDIPTPAEIRAMIAASRGRQRPFMLTAVFTGLRGSELRGLLWRDVDLKKGELHVRQRADRYNKIGAPKSEAGRRTVPIPPTVIAALREWKLLCPKSEHGLVFPTKTGQFISHQGLIDYFLAPIQVDAGITVAVLDNQRQPKLDEKQRPMARAKYTGLHALRHFYASWCINRKADGGLELTPKVVQERLGHSSIVMTMDVYGHLFPRADDSAELAAAEKALIG